MLSQPLAQPRLGETRQKAGSRARPGGRSASEEESGSGAGRVAQARSPVPSDGARSLEAGRAKELGVWAVGEEGRLQPTSGEAGLGLAGPSN